MSHHREKEYLYKIPAELKGGKSADRPVVIIGAGPVGLAAAVDLAPAQYSLPDFG